MAYQKRAHTSRYMRFWNLSVLIFHTCWHIFESNQDNRNSHTNFVNEPWTIQYLKDRRALPVNFNPTVVLTDAKQEFNRPTQLQRGVQIIYTAAKYHLTLRDELMHPDVFHLKQKPSKNTTLMTKYLPNIRVSLKSKGIENQAMR